MAIAQLPDADTLYAAAQRAGLVALQIHVFETLGSTSHWLKKQRNTFEHALSEGVSQLCVTDWQQSGVGRRGKVWHSGPGNVTFSVLSRAACQPAGLMGLSLVTGIAVSEVLQKTYRVPVMLKWPNDLILHNCKLGGLLTEVLAVPQSGRGAHTLCCDTITGVGLNLFGELPVAVSGLEAISLEQAQVDIVRSDRDALLGELCASVCHAHQCFYREGWQPFAERWQALDWLRDKPVSIHTDKAVQYATARGVESSGALRVESGGHIQPVYAGNVSVRPKL